MPASVAHDATIDLRRVRDPKTVLLLGKHGAPVTKIQFSKNGKWVYSLDDHEEIRIHPLPPDFWGDDSREKSKD